MKEDNKTLFADLTQEESATVNGGHYRRYYRPCRSYYRPRYYSRRSYGGGSGYGSSVNQTVNVNVLYND